MLKNMRRFNEKLAESIRKNALGTSATIVGQKGAGASNLIRVSTESNEIVDAAVNSTLTYSPPTAAWEPQVTTLGLWHMDGAGTYLNDASDREHDLTTGGVSVGAHPKFGTSCGIFVGSLDTYVTTTLSNRNQLVRDFLFVGAWCDGEGIIFNWPGVLVLNNNGTNIVATVMGEDIIGPAVSGSGYKFCGCQFTQGKVFILFDEYVTIADATATELTPSAYTIYWGKDGVSDSFDGYMDELYIDDNVVVEYDLPVYPAMGFPGDIGRWRFNEGYGDIAHPVVPIQNPIYFSNVTWDVSGKHAMVLNGSNGYGRIQTLPVTTSQSLMTIEVMLKFSSVASAQTILSQTNGINLAWDTTGIVANLYNATAGTTPINIWTPETDTWYLISVVYDGAYKYCYINGQLSGKIASTGNLSTAADMYVGRTVGGLQYFNGQIGFLSISLAKLRPYKRPFPKMIIGKHGFDGKTEWML